ncbi:uncharacterized protein TNIN_220601 [Trichonephila inaurata madagascariensis]|uniref:Non-homologous end-joining factor 1 n=1 Tax=Trichonephila inaurata madagascariensis TaxID=2747483 RepID=A0A8X6Y0H1_9ARAC|nr:uncharacterized protein TNIN_220601 [Trichonephila inaurata madagascariensis]
MEESYDELRDVDWIQIPNSPFIMKSKFDEDGYSLMTSDLKTVYVEKLDEKAVQERFQILNPHAEMRSKVILKHVKKSLESILNGNPTDSKIDFAEDKISFHLKFTASGVLFIFDLLLHSMTNDKIRDYVIAPTLLSALILNEENLALKRKIEELEKKEYSMPFSNTFILHLSIERADNPLLTNTPDIYYKVYIKAMPKLEHSGHARTQNFIAFSVRIDAHCPVDISNHLHLIFTDKEKAEILTLVCNLDGSGYHVKTLDLFILHIIWLTTPSNFFLLLVKFSKIAHVFKTMRIVFITIRPSKLIFSHPREYDRIPFSGP